MKIINLRPHHLLCIQGYQGKGYNKDFINKMNEVFGILKNQNSKVKLIKGCDDICSECPYQKNKICKKSGKSNFAKLKKETDLVERLGLKFDEIYEIGNLFGIINSQILSKKQADDFYCRDCEWKEDCLWYLGKK